MTRHSLRGALVAIALPLVAGLPVTARADGSAVPVVAGAFVMGSDGDDGAEAPAHVVLLASFWIDRVKVTNREFAAFLDARGLHGLEGESYFDGDDPDARIHRDRDGRFVPLPGFAEHPVVEVSWFGAREYCAWRGKLLPTEAEWEKAARGADGRRHPWGNEPPTPARAVYGRGYNQTEAVGRHPAGASPWGAQDMVGNVREWTSSQFWPYPYRRADGREDPSATASRVVRGASHDDGPDALRVTIRRYYEHRGTARGHHHVGFRCAASEPPGGDRR